MKETYPWRDLGFAEELEVFQNMKLTRGVVAVVLVGLGASVALGQGTAFTFQGRLDSGGAPANGSYDLVFSLFGAGTGGTASGVLTNLNVGVSNGLFSVTLDYGANAFSGASEWLEIAARSNSVAGGFATLAPRQALNPTPYAIYAGGANAAGLRGTVPSGALGGTYTGTISFSNKGNSYSGNGAGLTNLAASSLAGSIADGRLSANVALRAGGNSFSGSQSFLGPITANNGLSVNYITANGMTVDGISIPNGNGISFGNASSDGANGYTLYQNFYGNNNFAIARYVNGVGYPSDQAIVLAPGGNVGIGTTVPGAKLHVASGADSLNTIEAVQSGNGASAIYGRFTGSSGYAGFFDGPVGVSGTITASAVNAGVLHAASSANSVNSVEAIQSGNGASAIYGRFTGTSGFAGFFDGPVAVSGEVTCNAVNLTSDRNAKERFRPIDPKTVLDKVAKLPITEWQYKTQAEARHMGPMAQDFREAFGLGHDDKHITSIDEDGVALAAIQGLNQKLEEQSKEVREKDARIAELERSVETLRRLVNRLVEASKGELK